MFKEEFPQIKEKEEELELAIDEKGKVYLRPKEKEEKKEIQKER